MSKKAWNEHTRFKLIAKILKYNGKGYNIIDILEVWGFSDREYLHHERFQTEWFFETEELSQHQIEDEIWCTSRFTIKQTLPQNRITGCFRACETGDLLTSGVLNQRITRDDIMCIIDEDNQGV